MTLWLTYMYLGKYKAESEINCERSFRYEIFQHG